MPDADATGLLGAFELQHLPRTPQILTETAGDQAEVPMSFGGGGIPDLSTASSQKCEAVPSRVRM